ncbi:protein of unknown function [Pararobbsia alpina]
MTHRSEGGSPTSVAGSSPVDASDQDCVASEPMLTQKIFVCNAFVFVWT